MECRIAIAVFPVLLVIGTTMGCVDKHTDPNRPERTSSSLEEDSGVPHSSGVKVNVPGVSVETGSKSSGTDRKVEVDVGPGGVRVDVDGKSLRERLRESAAPQSKSDTRP